MKKSKKTTFTKALSVHAIIRRRENNLLTIPSFQRGEVWSIYQKQLLIDSLLREIDIPKLYFSEYEKDGRECWDIVDGQQRVSAIVSFIKNEFLLKDDAEPVARAGPRRRVIRFRPDEPAAPVDPAGTEGWMGR